VFINVGYQVLIVRTEPMDLSVNRELVVASNRFSKLEYVSYLWFSFPSYKLVVYPVMLTL